ncbi:hypothetical protein BJM55_06865 [Listeria monocytogenes]|nr:hypothetical protein BJM55_06865 [Listeria monocytogenes]
MFIRKLIKKAKKIHLKQGYFEIPRLLEGIKILDYWSWIYIDLVQTKKLYICDDTINFYFYYN